MIPEPVSICDSVAWFKSCGLWKLCSFLTMGVSVQNMEGEKFEEKEKAVIDGRKQEERESYFEWARCQVSRCPLVKL